jgi:uracil-xanthine permease
MGYFPSWTEKTEGIVAPDERLPWPQTFALGLQHVVAMFGATVLAPLLMGFDPNVAILMSGVGTLIFFFIVGGRVPSYLGSSFAFIGVVIAATGYAGKGANANIGVALGGIIVCGLVYALIGVLVHFTNVQKHTAYADRSMQVDEIESGKAVHWIEWLMPPVVTGSVVAVIGLNLAPIAAKGAMGAAPFDAWMAVVTVLCVGGVAVFTRGLLQKLLILAGLIAAYLIYLVLANGMGMGKPIDFGGLAGAAWIGAPKFSAPVFEANAIFLIVPVAVILVAENLGHVKAVAAMTGRDLDRYLGRAFIGDGVATMVAGSTGGTGVTTYAENIGVMAATKIYSSLMFVVAALIAIVLGFSPKFGALIQTIPGPVLGGVSIVVFGLIAAAGAKIWVDSKVDFTDNRNLITAAVTLVLGAGDFALKIGNFTLGGIGTATFGAILLYALLRAGGGGR